MKVLMVTAHPRRASLTHAVAQTIAASMRSNGHDVELADLVSEGFDPVMH
jgi:NAD(P)H dehydrogenase (quinone)